MLVLPMHKLSTDGPVLRRQLYRAYRTWLTGMGVYRPARILRRKKDSNFYKNWDLRFARGTSLELGALLLHEVPVAMAAALGRVCRDRRIDINVRMVLARDYRMYRRFAEWSAESSRKHDRMVKKTRNLRLRIAKMKKPGLRPPSKRNRQKD